VLGADSKRLGIGSNSQLFLCSLYVIETSGKYVVCIISVYKPEKKILKTEKLRVFFAKFVKITSY